VSVKVTQGSSASMGMDIMRRISDGEVKKAPIEYVEQVKRQITDNCEELIEVGARVRPLIVRGKQVGWVRGIHPQERRMFKRWIQEPNDFVLNVLLLATTFTKEEIESMSSDEVKSLTTVVHQMTDYDMSLYPYLSAYVTTQSSENLWYGKGESLTSYENKMITLPDGKQMKIMAPPDHSRVWASLCQYREQSKTRLQQDWQALFIVRPWAGKQADPIANELKGVARTLETDSMEPWERVVRYEQPVNKNDGWGHPGDTLEDLQRELKGMIEGDKHEKLMEAWSKQMIAEAEEKRKKIEDARKLRGTQGAGLVESAMTVVTEAEVRARQKALREGKSADNLRGAVPRREEHENSGTTSRIDKILKYT
jgi:hypothetical protein